MFKVGQKVRVKEGLVANKEYHGLPFTMQMQAYCGKEYVVSHVDCNNDYHLNGTGVWWFNNDMLEPVPAFKPGDRVRIIGVKERFGIDDGYKVIGRILTVEGEEHKYSEYDDTIVVRCRYDGYFRSQCIPVSCIEKVKTVWAKENNSMNSITSGKAYDVLACSRFRGMDFFTITNDEGNERKVLTGRFSEEPPKEEKAPHDDSVDAFMYGLYGAVPGSGLVGFPSFKSETASLYNVVFVTHADIDYRRNQYLYRLPWDVKINAGDALFVKISNFKKRVTAVTGSFKINKDGLDAIDFINGNHHDAVEFITGYAQEQEEWKEVPLNDH